MSKETVFVLTKEVVTWENGESNHSESLLFASKSKGLVEELARDLLKEEATKSQSITYQIDELLLI